MLTTSVEGIELIEGKEQFVDHLYNDASDPPNCTVGIGTLVHKGPICGDPSEEPYKNGITYETAKILFMSKVYEAEKALHRLIKVPLDQSEFDALIDFVYNLGPGALEESTLLRKLNASDYDGAAGEFHKWVFANHKKLSGLATRRAEEKALFDRDLPRVPVA